MRCRHPVMALLSTFFLFAESVLPASGADPVLIGASVPLSGDAAPYGTDIKNGLEFAASKLSGGRYKLIIEDDRCSEREAVTVAHKLVDIDKVKYVLGFGCSGALLAAAPIYEKAKVVVIASATGAPAITGAGDYIFRTIPSLNVAAAKLAAYASKKFKKVAVLSEETAYCQGLAEAFERESSGKLERLIQETFLPGTADFRTQLSKLRAQGAEALFANPQSESGLVTIYKQLSEAGWNVPVIAAYYPGSPVFLEAFGKKADGIVYADLPFNTDLLNANGLKIYEQFEKKYGRAKSGEFNITLSYAAMSALRAAIESAWDVREYLYTHRFTGIIDGYSFDRNGDVVSDKITFVLKVIRDGAPAPLPIDLAGSPAPSTAE